MLRLTWLAIEIVFVSWLCVMLKLHEQMIKIHHGSGVVFQTWHERMYIWQWSRKVKRYHLQPMSLKQRLRGNGMRGKRLTPAKRPNAYMNLWAWMSDFRSKPQTQSQLEAKKAIASANNVSEQCKSLHTTRVISEWRHNSPLSFVYMSASIYVTRPKSKLPSFADTSAWAYQGTAPKVVHITFQVHNIHIVVISRIAQRYWIKPHHIYQCCR